MSVSPSRLGLQVCVLVINIKKEKEKKKERTELLLTNRFKQELPPIVTLKNVKRKGME